MKYVIWYYRTIISISVTGDGGNLNCDFEESMCSWGLTSSPPGITLALRRQRGPTRHDNTGPPSDHTRGNSLGYYVYLGKWRSYPEVTPWGSHPEVMA